MQTEKIVCLSYPLKRNTPAYGNGTGLKIEEGHCISKGDSCNTSVWILPNHLGTHIDLPKHFVQNGKTITDYTPDFWIFHSPYLLDISPVSPGKIISQDDIKLSEIRQDVDLLIIKTGFCEHRDDTIYWQKNPGFDPFIAELLRNNFPRLRVLGFDSISLSSISNRNLGRKAHKAFLSNEHPILLLEDMDLSKVNSNTLLKMVIISPIFVENADGAPCTIFGSVLDNR